MSQSQSRDELPREGWHDFLELLTKERQGDDVTIEVLSLDYGDQLEAEKLPFSYIEYDPKDDMVNVGVGGRDSRYPAVLRHTIEHPQRILVSPPLPGQSLALDILGSDGSQTLITFHRRPALPG
jgi:hypothetical protein